MGSRPSEPLLKILRETAQKKGLNTAALATAAGLDRTHLKQVLSGRIPLTVDELIALGQALQIQASDLGLADAPAEEPPVALAAAAPTWAPDPYGNHAEQALKLGFALGCDLYFSLVTEKVQHSGVPRLILQQHKPNLPIRLDAAYHRHNDPQFLPEGLQIKLSFDAIYTCLFPWDAFHQVTFFPLAPPPPPEKPKEEPPPPARKGGHLRLVE